MWACYCGELMETLVTATKNGVVAVYDVKQSKKKMYSHNFGKVVVDGLWHAPSDNIVLLFADEVVICKTTDICVPGATRHIRFALADGTPVTSARYVHLKLARYAHVICREGSANFAIEQARDHAADPLIIRPIGMHLPDGSSLTVTCKQSCLIWYIKGQCVGTTAVNVLATVPEDDCYILYLAPNRVDMAIAFTKPHPYVILLKFDPLNQTVLKGIVGVAGDISIRSRSRVAAILDPLAPTKVTLIPFPFLGNPEPQQVSCDFDISHASVTHHDDCATLCLVRDAPVQTATDVHIAFTSAAGVARAAPLANLRQEIN